jgi:hypothetical protein
MYQNNSDLDTVGTQRAASTLFWAGYTFDGNSFWSTQGGNPSGTWQILGYNNRGVSVWQRVS